MRAFFLVILAAVVCIAQASDDGGAWIVRPQDAKYGPKEEKSLDRSDVFEVVASKVSVATSSELSKKQFFEISEKTAKYYIGAHYRCPRGKKPYLIRAVYTFGGTGHFLVVRHADSIWVEHQALGSTPISHFKSALVVNLDFVPVAAYATASVIE